MPKVSELMSSFFLIQRRHAEERKYEKRRIEHVRNGADNAYEARVSLYDVNANYNKGFAARKLLLGLSTEVNCEIPLNRYSFFEELQDKLSPQHENRFEH